MILIIIYRLNRILNQILGSIIAWHSNMESLHVEFIPTIYRLILDIEPVRTEDLELVQPDLYKNLMI